MIVQFEVPGDIVPWARAGGHGHIRFTPGPQRNFMAVIRQFASDAMAGSALLDGPLELRITATYQWPKAMTPKKRAKPGADLKTTRPDAGNIAKIVEDALNQIVWVDVARVSDTHIFKRLGETPGLFVSVRSLP